MGISADELIRYNECAENQYRKYQESIRRRANGEPYAYIIGNKEFMKLKFKVDASTLIPRDDTEILVQKAIEEIESLNEIKKSILVAKKEKIRVLDMCTGSGCIAIALAKYVSNCEVDGVDISQDALKIAIENASSNNVKVNFIKSNLFEKINNHYDMIVSNPPYIVSSVIENLQREVQKEPHIALDGGEDGLYFYRKIAKEATNFLKNSGMLLFEIGFDQGKKVSEILLNEGYKNIEVIKDLSGNDRVIVCYYEKGEEE